MRDPAGQALILHVKVVPGASRDRVAGRYGDGIKIQTSAPPEAGKANGEVVASDSQLASEVEAWAIMGMNVFLGLRFAVWGKEKPADVARIANRMVRDGLKP